MEYRKRVEKLLLSSGREGMEKLLEWMAENGYYDEPAGACQSSPAGGSLAAQSLYVLGIMEDMAYLLLHDNEETLEAKRNSLAVCALLHRIGFLGTGLEETREAEAEKKSVGIVSSFIALDKEEERALLCNEMIGSDFAANMGTAGMDFALLLFFAEKWMANEGKNGVKG
ncbi:hypothetical protein [Eisenbergiella sp.]